MYVITYPCPNYKQHFQERPWETLTHETYFATIIRGKFSPI